MLFIFYLPALTSSAYDVFTVDDLMKDSIYLWTFDDVTDIKDLRRNTWARVNAPLQSTVGVRGQAVKTLGGAGTIHLAEDIVESLTKVSWREHTLSLWILYQSKGAGVSQTFLAAGDQENGAKGTHLYQEDGSREELTFKLTSNTKRCSHTVGVSQRVWTHLTFTWKQSTGVGYVTIYRNGKRVPDTTKHCNSGVFTDLQDSDIKLGSTQQPLASFDDIIVWNKVLDASQVEKLFRIYKGKLLQVVLL